MANISYEFVNKDGIVQNFEIRNYETLRTSSLEELIDRIKNKLPDDGNDTIFYPKDLVQFLELPFKYSKQEIELFDYFGFEDLMFSDSIEPFDVYETVALHVFKNNKHYLNSKAVDALRVGLNYFDQIDPPIKRGTPEFDELIKF